MTLEFSYTPLPPLLTVAEAKALHLRIQNAAHDDDIQEKLETAQEAILRYLTTAVDPAWDATTVPKDVKHAILLLTAHYYTFRGDDANGDTAIWQEIANLLGMHRDPTLA
jgi:Phage gp6-like head-tail connector protein